MHSASSSIPHELAHITSHGSPGQGLLLHTLHATHRPGLCGKEGHGTGAGCTNRRRDEGRGHSGLRDLVILKKSMCPPTVLTDTSASGFSLTLECWWGFSSF